VVFDMDGVLVDTEPLHFRCLNRVVGMAGGRISEAENQAYIGATQDAVFRAIIARHGLPGALQSYLDHYNAVVLEALQGPLDPVPGAPELLARLRALGVPLAVASSSNRAWIDATLGALGLAPSFPVVAAGDEVAHSKPAPDVFLLAAARLGVPPTACVAVEDSPNGVRAARAAGMRVVAVRTPYVAAADLPPADLVVDSLAELTPAALGIALPLP
jgi:HAD superfamily hydrolase (TIGR01509 family)